MTKALFRDTLRAIRKTLSRFISIVIIVALGVGFFAGLKAVSPNMKAAADDFYDQHRLANVVANSTVGFDEEDVRQVLSIPSLSPSSPIWPRSQSWRYSARTLNILPILPSAMSCLANFAMA